MSEEKVNYKTDPLAIPDDIITQIESAILRVLAHGWGDVRIEIGNHKVKVIATSTSDKIL